MTTKNLIINNELGSFTFNEESLKALGDFITFSLPLVNNAIDSQDGISTAYAEHLENVVRPLVRNIHVLLNCD